MKATIPSTLILCLLWSCSPSSTSTETADSAWSDSLTLKLSKIYEQGLINGFGVAIANEDGTLYQQGFGYADMVNQTAYTDGTIQNIASISKTFLGIALMKAQEEGKLSLDDPINQYLPFTVANPKFPEVAITIRHLATHTSSIYDTDFYDKSYVLKDPRDSASTGLVSDGFQDADSLTSMGHFLEKYLSAEGALYLEEGFISYQPGDRYEYSNVGATLAAYVLELAVGEPYRDYSAKHILKPLGMTQSGWSFDAIDLSMHTKLYQDPKSELPFYSLITYPDGGLLTSVNDLGKYLTELIKGKSGAGTLLSPESYQELFREQLTEANFEERDTDRDFDDEYNSGIFMGHAPNGQIGHTGGDPGVSTFLFFDPKTKTGRLLFINTGIDQEGAKEFFEVWNALGEYVDRSTR